MNSSFQGSAAAPPRRRGPAIRGAGEHSSPVAITATSTPTCLFVVELIDTRSAAPGERVAWNRRAAAINVGISRAAYLPALTASAVAGGSIS